MTLVGFEPMIPVFKPAKTFHASDRAATVTGSNLLYTSLNVSIDFFIFSLVSYSLLGNGPVETLPR
jgi:hypothetical protein